jgi:hypothetical protein
MNDSYGFVATQTIMHNGVVAYQPGDLVPDDNVHELGYLDAGQVVAREDYQPEEGQPAVTLARAGAATVRGEMPEDLRTATDEGGTEAEDKGKPATRTRAKSSAGKSDD